MSPVVVRAEATTYDANTYSMRMLAKSSLVPANAAQPLVVPTDCAMAANDGRLDLAAITQFDLDYDGYGSTAGMFTGDLGGTTFVSLAELNANTTEVHAIEIGPSVFATGATVPSSAFPAAAPPDLRLAADAVAVDAGEVIPGFAYQGAAPDLGAHELGEPLPTYGPRP